MRPISSPCAPLLDRLRDALEERAAPMVWMEHDPWAFFLLQGQAPDPLGFGYSKAWGEGMGLPAHRHIPTTHRAVFWLDGARDTRAPHFWLGEHPAPKPSAHGQLAHARRTRRLKEAAHTFATQWADLEGLERLMQAPQARLALCFGMSGMLHTIHTSILYTSLTGHHSISCGQGIEMPYALRQAA